MLKDMQVVRKKGFTAFRKGEITLSELELVMEFVEKVGFVENLNLTTDQMYSDHKGLFRDNLDYGISMRDIEKGLEVVDSMYANSLCSSWPIFSRNFDCDSFLSCGDNIQPQSIRQKGLYVFTTKQGFKIPVYYDPKDQLELIVATNGIGGALCALPSLGRKFCSFVNRNTDRLISMELIKTPEEIEKELGPVFTIHDVFRLANGGKDLVIHDKTMWYRERRVPSFIKINFDTPYTTYPRRK